MLSFNQYCEALNHQVQIISISPDDFEEQFPPYNELADKVVKISHATGIRFNWAKDVTIAALVDGEVVGGVASEISQDGRYWTYDFDTVVDPKWQGPLMIGFRLIDAAIKDARHQESMVDIIRCDCVHPGLKKILISKYGFTTYNRRTKQRENRVVFKYFPR